MSKKAVILLSGGLDSVTTMALAASEGFEIHALSFDYGQKHRVELQCAAAAAAKFNAVEHRTASIRFGIPDASALTSEKIDVPDYSETAQTAIPVTYVPARNLVFLSCAVALAESTGARDIFIGVNSVDYSGYPDCRPEFISSFSETARLGTRAVDDGWKYNIRAPLQNMRKTEIIRLGLSLGVDYSMTHSCYNPTPDGRHCGRCDSCMIRAGAFAELGMKDPAR